MIGAANRQTSAGQQIAMASDELHLPRFLSSVNPDAARIDPRLRSYGELALRQAEGKLIPADTDDFRRQLTACLVLVAPTGMTQEDRNEWLRAAWGTLENLPPDLLEAGCEVARETCDHPSKIVPTITRTVDAAWRKRRDDRSRVIAALAKMTDDKPAEPRCTPEQAAEVIRRVGLKMPDLTPDRSHRGPPIAPDRAWYIAHGVDPDVLIPAPVDGSPEGQDAASGLIGAADDSAVPKAGAR